MQCTSTLSPVSLCGSGGGSGWRRADGCGRGDGCSWFGGDGGDGATTDRGGDGPVFDIDTTKVPVLWYLISNETEDAKMPVGGICRGRSSNVLDDLS